MKKNVILSGLLLLCNYIMFAQQTFINENWKKQHSLSGIQDQMACGVDPNGNFIFLGNVVNNANNSDIILSCVHPNGNTAWQQTCPSSPNNDDYGIDLKIDAQANIYVAGVHHNGSNTDYFTAKYDQMGNLIWQNYFNGTANGDDQPVALEIDVAGNVYVTGTSYGGWTMTDMVTIKYDNNGNQLWLKTYNYNNKVEVARDILIDNNGDIVTLCTSANSWDNSDFTIRKYNANGNVLATKRHNTTGEGYDLPSKIAVDNNNNYYVTGTSESNGNKNIKTIAYNSNLQVKWVKYIDNYQTDEGYDIAVDNLGSLVVTGYVTNNNGGLDGIIIKYETTNGVEIWQKTLSTLDALDIAKAKTVIFDNENIYVGSEITTNGQRNFLYTILDSLGNIITQKEFVTTGNSQLQKLTKQNNIIYLSGIVDSVGVKKATTVKVSTLTRKIHIKKTKLGVKSLSLWY